MKRQFKLGFKVFKLAKSSFKNWKQYEGKSVEELKKEIQHFKSPLLTKYKEIDLIYEILVKEAFSLNSNIQKIKTGQNLIYKINVDESSTWSCYKIN